MSLETGFSIEPLQKFQLLFDEIFILLPTLENNNLGGMHRL